MSQADSQETTHDWAGIKAPAETLEEPPAAARRVLGGAKGGFLCGVLLVIVIGLSISAYHYERFPGDLPISEWVQSISLPLFDDLMEGISVLGDWTAGTVMTTVAVVLLWLFKRRADAAYLIVMALGSTFLNRLVKALVDRPRPSTSLVEVSEATGSNSFPSGHTLFAIAFFGLIILYLYYHEVGPRWARWAAQGFLIALIIGMGFSRVYLGVHWPSDALGSYAFGALYLLGIMWLRDRISAAEDVRLRLPSFRRG